MEAEKQRKMHKEQMEKEREEQDRLRMEREKAAKEAIMAQKEGNDSEPSLPKKSRFVSLSLLSLFVLNSFISCLSYSIAG